jgi:alkylation response protein AidB-like acyl-CoA dehydrogenase
MFEASGDQELLQETTRRFLEAEAPIARLRSLATTPEGFDNGFWRQGAELGWSSLLVPEEAGGGSVSGEGVLDLALVAYEFGKHAAPGPLGPVNIVAAALGEAGTDEQKAGPLSALLSGEAVGAWAHSEPPPNSGLGDIATTAEACDGGFVLRGTKTAVEAGCEAAWLLVSARDGNGISHFLVPSASPGVTLTALEGLDMTRRYAAVTFDDASVPPTSLVGARGTAGDRIEHLTDLAVVIQLAEMVGAMQWAFDTTLDWAFNRYSFGRPLSSYQEIKHRFADMKMWLEGSYAIAEAAARAVQADSADRSEKVSAGKYYIGRYGAELMQDCIQLHGGIGVTFDHDLHIFLRRFTTDIPTHGGPSDHANRIVALLDS